MNHEEHEGHEEERRRSWELAGVVVDAGLKVHRALGPGLLEPAYEHCLAYELAMRDIEVRRQVELLIVYAGNRIDAAHRLDLVIGDCIVVEVKAVEKLIGLYDAQIITYLKVSGYRVGFLMNFYVVLFKNGLKRFVR